MTAAATAAVAADSDDDAVADVAVDSWPGCVHRGRLLANVGQHDRCLFLSVYLSVATVSSFR